MLGAAESWLEDMTIKEAKSTRAGFVLVFLVSSSNPGKHKVHSWKNVESLDVRRIFKLNLFAGAHWGSF